MANILYFDITKISEADMQEFLPLLPQFMQLEVLKYVRLKDRKARLAARLMLLQSLQKDGKAKLIYNWSRNEQGKPWIPDWHPFSISHAGDMVLLSWANGAIGVDIELKYPFHFDDVLYLFHPNERLLIKNASRQVECFFELWVKKEAFLKATGRGISDELSQYDCSGSSIKQDKNYWHFHRFVIDASYVGFICTTQKKEFIRIQRVDSFLKILD